VNTKNHSSIKSKRDNPSSQKQPSRPLPSYVVVFISIIVLAYYIWTAGSNGVPLIVDVGPEHHEQIRTPNLFPDISPHHYGFYNLMADAFEAGRLDLLIDPPKELAELPNPRNTIANQQTRILDLSLYKKRFYIYFGAVPALTVFIPFRWLGIGKISEPFAVAIFSYGLYLCSLYILLTCVRRFIPNANKNLTILSIFAIAFSTAIPYNLRHPVVYEVAICSGAFFAMLGLALFLAAWDKTRFKIFLLISGSLAFGLSVGCRPIYIFATLFIFLLWLFVIFKCKLGIASSLKNGFALALPFSLCVFAIVLHNYIRFGSPSEFGMSYMLNATEWDLRYMNRLCNIPPGLFLTMLCPPQISSVFPFIRLQQFYPFELPTGYVLEEFSGGFLVTSPIIIACIILLCIFYKKFITKEALVVAGSLLCFGFSLLIIESYMMFGNTMRYQMDYAPTIILGSVVGCIYFESHFNASITKKIMRWGMFILITFGVITHLAFGMTGIFDTFRRGEPKQYFALEDVLRPISTLLTPFYESDQTRILDITIPSGSARFEDGTEGPWLGEEGFYVRFTAAQTIPMQFSADVVVRPDLPDGVKLDFQNTAGTSKSSVIKGTSRQTFQFTLQPGSNRISIFATPNSPILKDQDKLRVAVLRNIQITPNSTR
jgi:hypothetical protein